MPNDIPVPGDGAPAAVTTATDGGLAEERLRQLEERYGALVRATGQINWTTDAEGLVVEDLPSWRAFTGQAVERMLGKGWLDAVHPEDRPTLEVSWRKSVRLKRVHEMTYRARRHDGIYRTLLDRGVPVLNADGTIREWVGCCTDVTELQTARSEAEQHTRQLEAILAAIPERLAVFDAEGTLIHMNPASRAAAGQERGYERKDRLTQAYGLRKLDGTPLTTEEIPLSRALEGEHVANEELLLRGARGQDEQILVSAAPFYDEAGRLDGVVTLASNISALHEAQHEAATRAGQLQAVFDAMSDAVLVYDAEAKLREMNSAARALFRLDAVQSSPNRSQRPYAERVAQADIRDMQGHPLDHERWGIPRLLRGETITAADGLDVLMRRGDGEEAIFSLTGTAIRDGAGNISGAVMVCRDMTERRKLGREVRERAAQLEATFQAMVNGVVIYDADGRIIGMNPAALALFGSAAEPSFIERPIDARTRQIAVFDGLGQPLAPDEWPGARILRGEVLVGAQAMDVMFHTRDGREVWTTVTGAPVRDSDGRIVGGIVLYHDVTERQQAQRRTHETLAALLAMAEALVQDPAVSRNADEVPTSQRQTRLATAHRLAELTASILGCTRVSISTIDPETQMVRAIAVVGLTPEQEPQWWLEQEQQAARLGEGADPEQVARFAAGETIVVDYTQPPLDALPNPYSITTALAVPMRTAEQLVGILALDYGGEPHVFQPDELALAGAVGKLAAAVIERERLLRQRAEDEAQVLALSEANKRMDEFLGIASHELRTPVTVIKANVQLLRRRIQADAVHVGGMSAREVHLLQSTERQVDRLVRLVNDLVDVSRVRAGKLEPRQEPCELAAIVRDAVEGQRLASSERTITLTLPAEPIAVVADADRIGQVVTNYVTNALKYSPTNQPVAVELRRDGHTAWLGVRDRGQGIPLDEQPKVWDLFYRVPGVDVQSGSGVGLGLGLHICQTIVERHGGEVGVESTPGKGATFWFTLPLDEGAVRD
jgi:PAS domain S-box-containing protein